MARPKFKLGDTVKAAEKTGRKRWGKVVFVNPGSKWDEPSYTVQFSDGSHVGPVRECHLWVHATHRSYIRWDSNGDSYRAWDILNEFNEGDAWQPMPAGWYPSGPEGDRIRRMPRNPVSTHGGIRYTFYFNPDGQFVTTR